MNARLLIGSAAALALAGCVHRAPGPGYEESGVAGWYGPGFDGHRTASGAIFHSEAMTCAHRTLPFGAILEVIRDDDGRRVRVTVTDRGPFVSGRIVDLSQGAARKLGLLHDGVTRVHLRVIALPR